MKAYRKKYRIVLIIAAAVLIFTAVFTSAVRSPDIDFAGAVRKKYCAEVSFSGNEMSFITGDDFSSVPGDSIYVNGNIENKAYIFYLKKTGDSPYFRVCAGGADEGIFYGASSVGVQGLLTAGIYKDGEFAWQPVRYFNDNSKVYIDIPVGSVPVGEGFIAAVRAQKGVIAFDSLKLQGYDMLDVSALADSSEISSLLSSDNMLPSEDICLTEPENNPPALIAFMHKIIDFIKRLFHMMGGR